MAFTESLKLKICQEVSEKALSVADAAARCGCAVSTIYSWLSAYEQSKESKSASETLLPNKLSMLDAISLAAVCQHFGWKSEQTGAECRKHGVKVSELAQFFDACKADGVESAKSNKALKREINQLRKQASNLQKENGRLEKALAETTTCLVELKKAQAFFTTAED